MDVIRFTAQTTKAALNQIKKDLGEDAVILSCKKTSRGVEIIAAPNGDSIVSLKERDKKTDNCIVNEKNKVNNKINSKEEELLSNRVTAEVLKNFEERMLGHFDQHLKQMQNMILAQGKLISSMQKQSLSNGRHGVEDNLLTSDEHDAEKRLELLKQQTTNSLLRLGFEFTVIDKYLLENKAYLKKICKENNVDLQPDSLVTKFIKYCQHNIKVDDIDLIGNSKHISITGTKGVGKSTICLKLVIQARKQGLKVVVVAAKQRSLSSDLEFIESPSFFNHYCNLLAIPKVEIDYNSKQSVEESIKFLSSGKTKADVILYDNPCLNYLNFLYSINNLSSKAKVNTNNDFFRNYVVLAAEQDVSKLEDLLKKINCIDSKCILNKLDIKNNYSSLISTIIKNKLTVVSSNVSEEIDTYLQEVNLSKIFKNIANNKDKIKSSRSGEVVDG